MIPTLRAGGNSTGGDRPPGTDVDTCDSLQVTHSLTAEGFDASEDGTGRGTPLVPDVVNTLTSKMQGQSGWAPHNETAHLIPDVVPPLMHGSGNPAGHGARSGHCKDSHIVPVAMGSAQANAGRVEDGSPTLTCQHDGTPIVFEPDVAGALSADDGGQGFTTLQAASSGMLVPEGSSVTGYQADAVVGPEGVSPAISADCPPPKLAEPLCVDMCGGKGGANVSEGVSPALGTSDGHAVAFTQNQAGDVLSGGVVPAMGTNQNATGRNTPKVCCFAQNTRDEVREMDVAGALAAEPGAKQQQSGVREVGAHATLDANNGSRRHNGVAQGMQVRRLTPRECCRLMGFPDDYTKIPWKGRPAEECPDGPRYKALGNSFAVPVVRWIGERIAMVDELMGE